MRMPRWLSALLVLALLLSSAPASVLAGSTPPPPQQDPSAARSSSYLLSVTPPALSFPAQTRGFDAAGYVNIGHARRYAEVQAQLDALQTRGAIAGYAALPSAYAFTVRGPEAAALAVLASLGRLQATGDMSAAAAVGELRGAYQREISAAIAAGGRRPPPAAPARQPRRDHPQQPVAAAIGQPRTAAATTPTFDILLNNDEVYGYSVAPGTTVIFTLKTGSGVIRGSVTSVADSTGFVMGEIRDIYGNVVFTAPGDVLEVQTPDLITIPLVFLQVIPDVAAQRVTGFGPPNITNTDPMTPPYLELQISGSRYVTTTADGAFAADAVSLSGGSVGWLFYVNAGGHRIGLQWTVPILSARGFHSSWQYSYYGSPNYVSGAVTMFNAPVTVTLTRAGNPIAVNTVTSAGGGQFELYLRDRYNNGVPILAGDSLQATDGVVTTTVDVKSFTVLSDPDTDTLSGTTDAAVVTDTVGLPQTLSLWPTNTYASDYGKTVPAPGGSFFAANPFYQNADANGGWTILDWGPSQGGFLRYLDVQGNAVFDTFHARTPNPVLSLRGNVYAYVADNYVEGEANGVCGYGVVTLLDAANAVKAQNSVFACPFFSTNFTDVYGNLLPILDGDSVAANLNGRTTTVQAPSLLMLAYPDTDVVTGTITPGLVVTTTWGAPQSLTVYGSNYFGDPFQTVLPDAEGDFEADFTGIIDIWPGATGPAQYIDANGNSVFAQWQARPDKPTLRLRGYSGYNAENFVAVDLPAGPCDAAAGVDLAVRTEDGTVRWQKALPCSTTGLFLQDDYGNNINLHPGDVVRATWAGQTAVVTVPGFDVTSDAQTDTVSGVTNAVVTTTTLGLTQTLAIWPRSLSGYDEPGKHVLTAAGGAFTAANPFYWGANPASGETNLDWSAGDQGHLRYIDASGNQVYATFAAQVDQPQLRIEKDGSRVSGLLPEINAPVTITVMSGAAVKGAGYATSSLIGSFEMTIFDARGNPVAITEGDEVVLAQPATTVLIPPLSADVDVENDRVAGKGPANALLNVSVYYDFYPLRRSVATDADGNYLLDLRGLADVRSGDRVGVAYKNAQGHLIRLERTAGAMLSAALTTNRVWGLAPEKHLPVIVTVKRSGAVLGTDSFVNAGYEFTAFPVDATGQPVLLAAGDVVEVDFGAGVAKSLTLAALTLAVNEQTSVVSGVGPANSLLGLSVEATPNLHSASVTTGADGKWSADLAAQMLDIQPGDTASVRYTTNGTDMTWLYGVAPVFWLREWSYNRVHGYTAPYAPLIVTLQRGGSVLASAAAVADDNGMYDLYLNDVNGLPVSIAAGDVVEVRSAQTVAVTVPPLEIVLDSAARTVSGVGPANTALGLFTSAGSRTVQTDADGAFFAGFAGQTPDLIWAELHYQEPQGNWIYAATQQSTGSAAYLQARWDRSSSSVLPAAISGSVGGGPRQVLLSLRRSEQVAATASAWATMAGDFSAIFHNAAGQKVDILAGDVIEIAAGDVTRSMTIPALTVQVNAAGRTLFGTGPANAALGTNSCGGSATVDPSGAWVAQCSGNLGRTGYVFVTDLVGNSTYLGWSTPYVSVREYGNEVSGTSALGAAVQVRLLRGGAVAAEAGTLTDAGNGWFEVAFLSAGGSPVIIQPNDVVAVDAGQPITVPVTPLTAVVDPAADRISGVGPANAALEVYAAANTGGQTRNVTVAADGSYTADFAGAADIVPGSWINVTYVNPDDNVVFLGWNAPLVRINLGSDIVDGYATPNVLAGLALKRSGSVIATTQAQTRSSGGFSAFFLDGSGSLIDLAAGDEVEVTASPAVTAAAIALTANLDTRNDLVSGSGPAGAPILVVAWRCYVGVCNQAAVTAVASDAGVYVANFAGVMDLDQTSYAYVQAGDAAGNQTSITTTPMDTPQRTYVEAMIESRGASVVMSAYGTANWVNLTPPQPLDVAGGGRLVFYAAGGVLVVTAPDGTITRPNSSYYAVENPRTGKWQVQIEASGDLGGQYAVSAGLPQYNIYLPAVQRQ